MAAFQELRTFTTTIDKHELIKMINNRVPEEAKIGITVHGNEFSQFAFRIYEPEDFDELPELHLNMVWKHVFNKQEDDPGLA